MQDDVKRRAGPYEGDGKTKSFPFSFYVFSADDVKVVTSVKDSAVEETLEKDVDYSVTVNADQNATPGGTVVLTNALASNHALSILSDLAYTQEMQLTNFSRFPPEILNSAMDRTVILIQQLKEFASRNLTVPATSNQTPQELLTAILDTASKANAYAAEAKAIFEKSVLIDANVTANADSVALMKLSVDESERNVSSLAAQVNEYSDELTLVSENLDAVETVSAQSEAIQAIANDIQGFPIDEFDGGWTDEPDESMVAMGGVMRVCAENIEEIRKVAASISSVSITELADAVEEIGSTDYAQISNTGNTGA